MIGFRKIIWRVFWWTWCTRLIEAIYAYYSEKDGRGLSAYACCFANYLAQIFASCLAYEVEPLTNT
jgi:hypothetical protein